jgi:flagellar biosynthetic protein FliR
MINLESLAVIVLVTIRMTGMFVFNPIFGRRGVPPMVNAGLSLILAVCISLSADFQPLPELTLVSVFILALIELATGYVAGFILNLFLAVVVVGGEIVDMQLGLGMAKNFDPGTNASISLSATLFNSMFILTFFITNNHLTLIYMAAKTYDVIPLGAMSVNPAVLYYLPNLFSTVVLFAIKLCLPIVVLEVIVTMAVGIIMRIIPQINIFVVNIQFKLLVGMFALIVLVGPFMAFIENMILVSFERIQEAWGIFAGNVTF